MSEPTATPVFGSQEASREAGIRSGEARRRKRDMDPEERARDAARRLAPQLMSELEKAALGKGDFEKLDLRVRVQAILRLLEYGVGKPRLAESGKPDDGPDIPQSPEDLFT